MSNECQNKTPPANEADIDSILYDLQMAYEKSTQGVWGKGDTTHRTVARNKGQPNYEIADFRHADDATFVDLAHAHMPTLLQAFADLKARNATLEGDKK